MGNKRIAINGQFTARKMTGQERFAYEIVKELDLIVDAKDWVLVVPKDAVNIPKLYNIPIIKYGRVKGSLWEQVYFFYYTFRHNLLSLNLCSVMPVLKPGIICIHDLSYKVNPQYFKTVYSFISMLWHRVLFRFAWWFSPFILTVSEFSKQQMIDCYKVDADKIVVVGNGWEHFTRIKEDETIKERKPNLFSKPYFFSLGSLAPNKNIDWVLKIAQNHPQYIFNIAGRNGLKEYGLNYNEEDFPNVNFLGYITDGEIKYLMANCKAFIFPSFFEGFGIPPLEALSVGAKIIVSNTSCLPEIFGDSAYYIDPHNYNINLYSLLNTSVNDRQLVLNRFHFRIFAKKIYDRILKLNKQS